MTNDSTRRFQSRAAYGLLGVIVIGQCLKTALPAIFWLGLGAWGFWFHVVR